MLNAKGDRSGLSLTNVHGRNRGVEKGSKGLGSRGVEAVEARGHSNSGDGRNSEKSVIVSRDFPDIKLRAEGGPK